MMGKLQERCQIEMILNLPPVHLLFSDTRKEGKTRISRSRKENGKDHSMKSCDPNLNNKFGRIGKFMDRRHHLRLRQLGGNYKNSRSHRNDMNGKDCKNGKDGKDGANEQRSLSRHSK